MNVVEMPRNKLLTVRMSADEMAQLDELGKRMGVSGSDLVRNLVAEALTRVKLAAEREEKLRTRHWWMDKERLKKVVHASGFHDDVLVTFDDGARTATLVQNEIVVAGPAAPHEIELALAEKPQSLLVGWNETGAPFVATSRRTTLAVREVLAKRGHASLDAGGNGGFITEADVKKYGLRAVE